MALAVVFCGVRSRRVGQGNPHDDDLGQAAGVSAAICAKEGCTARHLTRTPTLVKKVQQILLSQGAYPGPRPLP